MWPRRWHILSGISSPHSHYLPRGSLLPRLDEHQPALSSPPYRTPTEPFQTVPETWCLARPNIGSRAPRRPLVVLIVERYSSRCISEYFVVKQTEGTNPCSNSRLAFPSSFLCHQNVFSHLYDTLLRSDRHIRSLLVSAETTAKFTRVRPPERLNPEGHGPHGRKPSNDGVGRKQSGIVGTSRSGVCYGSDQLRGSTYQGVRDFGGVSCHGKRDVVLLRHSNSALVGWSSHGWCQRNRARANGAKSECGHRCAIVYVCAGTGRRYGELVACGLRKVLLQGCST